jgi:DNA polymerase-3 subunit delta
VADLKPVYLVSGDDDAKIDAWRNRLRSRAEAEHGAGGLEGFSASATTADAVVAELAALTFAVGTRYFLIDDVGSWKAPDVEPLITALKSPPPDTVVMLVVRGKPLKSLVKAVEAAGGEIHDFAGPKPWEVPKWVTGRAEAQGLRLDGGAARTLVGIAGPGQQRLEREIEKIAIAVHPETHAGADEVEQYAAGDTAPKRWDLADAVVAGDRDTALRLAEDLVAHGEAPAGLSYSIVGRLREVLRVVELIDAGVSEGDIAKGFRGPPWQAKKALALARQADRTQLERAICRFADLEVGLRGGGVLDEQIAVTLTVSRAAA